MNLRTLWTEQRGFHDLPHCIRRHPGAVGWRVWGGTSGEGLAPHTSGLYLTFDPPATRADAEQQLAVLEHGNACLFRTPFRIFPDTPYWLGRVHPGDTRVCVPGVRGSQVFVERVHCHGVSKAGPAVRLGDGLAGFPTFDFGRKETRA